MITYASICDGIGAVHEAWATFGWDCRWVSEIEPFPCAVVDHHWNLKNLGDMNDIKEPEAVDLMVGGTPCQSFSVAGFRKGMDDPRGNLALVFLGLVDRIRPKWVVWENVPGVFSADSGLAFFSFVAGLEELGYGVCWRVLDAEYVRVEPGFSGAVPQRRRRVFVVGYIRDWRGAAAVLLEPEGLRGDSPPSRKAGEETARCLRGRSNASHREDSDNYVAHSLKSRYDGSEDGTGRGTPIIPDVAWTLQERDSKGVDSDTKQGHLICSPASPAVTSSGPPFSRTGNERVECEALVAFGWNKSPSQTMNINNDITEGLQASPSSNPAIQHNMTVRRLTPRECERLMGFPDDYTLVEYRGKPAKDGPRYKALGNSMAVNVMRWIGQRIQLWTELTNTTG